VKCECTFTSEGSVQDPCAVHAQWLKEAHKEFISAASWREQVLVRDVRRAHVEALKRLPQNDLEIAALARVIGVAEMLRNT
jgi:hypothetical protein